MPESKKRDKAVQKQKQQRKSEEFQSERRIKPTPKWWIVLMCAFLIAGLLWIITFYVTSGKYPIEPIGTWNIAVGIALAFIGFLMTLRWQ